MSRFPQGWETFFEEEIKKDYFQQLWKTVQHEYYTTTVYPPGKDVFAVFKLVRPEDVKIVLLGQDPYHGKNQANGIAFSTASAITPRSLANMFKELKSDLDIDHPSNDLSGWVAQGVFLLNTILTVREHQPLSHQELGWETFVLNVLNFLNSNNKVILYCAFGNQAMKMYSKINGIKSENILRYGHPSPFSYDKYFKGTRPFSQINSWLEFHDLTPINWAQ
ncbi:Uracil-DNA glycosylase [Mesoplasma sp. JKS002660]|nr:Uracil-DNA glycosylase [Mesoplasma sp. JKS002660]